MSPATSRPNGTSDDGGPAVPPSEPPSGPGEPPLHPAGTPSGVVPAGPPPGTAAGPPAAVPPYPVAVPTGWPAADRPRRSWRRSLGVHLGALLVLVLLGAAVRAGVGGGGTRGAGAADRGRGGPRPATAGGVHRRRRLVQPARARVWACSPRSRPGRCCAGTAGRSAWLVVVVGCSAPPSLAWRVGRRIGLAGYERLLQDRPGRDELHQTAGPAGGQYTWCWVRSRPSRATCWCRLSARRWSTPCWPAGRATRTCGPSPSRRVRAGAVSWDSAAPPAPPAAPAPPGPDGAEPPRG